MTKLYNFKNFALALGVLAVLIGIFIFFSGSLTKSKELKAMLASSASTIQLTTGREVKRWQFDKEVTFGKPEQAKVRIEYEPANNYTQEDVYDEIVAFLEETNWEKEKSYIDRPDYYRASLQQDDFSMLATVNIQSDRNIVSIQLITVP